MAAIESQLTALAEYLATRRPAILEGWRKAVDADPELSTASSLPRTQFYDHIPELLDTFERKLRACRWRDAANEEQETKDAANHGLQRWQQGYRLREVTREWGHLQRRLLDEIDASPLARSPDAADAMTLARRMLVDFCSDGVSVSTVQYFELRQTEAAGLARDLADTLREVQQLERRRAEMVRQAAHDLRGGLGVVSNATSGLTFEGLPEGKRTEFLMMLQRSVSSQQTMLDELMNLARLQAGHELRDVKPFDAALLLSELCDSFQFMTAERGLYLRREGPVSLVVEGDAVKTRRIAQNVLLNALKYTTDGGVTVSWGDSRNNDPQRWMLTVQDTGPGFHAGPGAPLAGALQEATKEARAVDARADEVSSTAFTENPDPRPVRQQRGEGIGLSIVKRLCELLDAGLELESTPNEGTILRVLFPRRYGLGDSPQI